MSGVPEAGALCDEFAALGEGAAVRFGAGEDFAVAPATFRNSLHRLMRERGWVIETRLDGSDVYARLACRA